MTTMFGKQTLDQEPQLSPDGKLPAQHARARRDAFIARSETCSERVRWRCCVFVDWLRKMNEQLQVRRERVENLLVMNGKLFIVEHLTIAEY
jgi:hypothetical protein